MTVYFTASIVGKRNHLQNYEKILNILKQKEVIVISDHIMKTSESQIRFETKQERLSYQNKIDTWINQASCVIAETSFPSISVGFEISIALHRQKPVLILFSEGDPPSLLAHHKDERLICEHYSKESLPDLIDDFINYVHGNRESRFTFFITAEIASFLDKIAQEKKIPKSVYLRRLIQKEMHKTLQ